MSEEIKEELAKNGKSEEFKEGFEEGFHKGVVQGYIKGHTDANEEHEKELNANRNFFQKIIANIVSYFKESKIKASLKNLAKAIKSMFGSLPELLTLPKIELEKMLAVEKAKAQTI
jgi:flagellar biosynthesis/type III secretory pathway protein FliH